MLLACSLCLVAPTLICSSVFTWDTQPVCLRFDDTERCSKNVTHKYVDSELSASSRLIFSDFWSHIVCPRMFSFVQEASTLTARSPNPIAMGPPAGIWLKESLTIMKNESWNISELAGRRYVTLLENPENWVALPKSYSKIGLLTHCTVSHWPGPTGGATIPHCPDHLHWLHTPQPSNISSHIQPETHCPKVSGSVQCSLLP